MSKREEVEHFVEGEKSWLLGWRGFFSKSRGILPGLLISVITASEPFWWPESDVIKLSISRGALIFTPLTIFVFVASGILFYFSRQARAVSEERVKLHKLAHTVRDEQYKMHAEDEFNFTEYSKRLCNAVRDYFRATIKDDSIEAVVRIAKVVRVNEEKKIVYRTLGRSDGLSTKRQETTENIPANKGIPSYFNKKDRQGVLIYNDIQKAAKKDLYQLTKNDEKYSSEIVTMMVAPLNAWADENYDQQVIKNKKDEVSEEDDRPEMIGLLYVTSRKSDVFGPLHVDSMCFAADLTASSISSTVEIQSKKIQGGD